MKNVIYNPFTVVLITLGAVLLWLDNIKADPTLQTLVGEAFWGVILGLLYIKFGQNKQLDKVTQYKVVAITTIASFINLGILVIIMLLIILYNKLFSKYKK